VILVFTILSFPFAGGGAPPLSGPRRGRAPGRPPPPVAPLT